MKICISEACIILTLLTLSPLAAEASQVCPRWPAGGAPNPQPHVQLETKEQEMHYFSNLVLIMRTSQKNWV